MVALHARNVTRGNVLLVSYTFTYEFKTLPVSLWDLFLLAWHVIQRYVFQLSSIWTFSSYFWLTAFQFNSTPDVKHTFHDFNCFKFIKLLVSAPNAVCLGKGPTCAPTRDLALGGRPAGPGWHTALGGHSSLLGTSVHVTHLFCPFTSSPLRALAFAGQLALPRWPVEPNASSHGYSPSARPPPTFQLDRLPPRCGSVRPPHAVGTARTVSQRCSLSLRCVFADLNRVFHRGNVFVTKHNFSVLSFMAFKMNSYVLLQMCLTLSRIFSTKQFLVLHFTFTYLVHFELIFVKGRNNTPRDFFWGEGTILPIITSILQIVWVIFTIFNMHFTI